MTLGNDVGSGKPGTEAVRVGVDDGSGGSGADVEKRALVVAADSTEPGNGSGAGVPHTVLDFDRVYCRLQLLGVPSYTSEHTTVTTHSPPHHKDVALFGGDKERERAAPPLHQ